MFTRFLGHKNFKLTVARSHLIDPGVTHDLEQPTVQASLPVPLIQVQQSSLHCDLHHIVGIVRIAHQTPREAPQTRQQSDDLFLDVSDAFVRTHKRDVRGLQFNPCMLTVLKTGVSGVLLAFGVGTMRLFAWTIIGMVGANFAQAQLRLPGVPQPALPQKLQTLGTTADNSLAQLADLRHLQISRLLRGNPHTVAADPRGNPIVREELLAFAPSEVALNAALGLGFRVVREQSIAKLGIRLVVLQPPQTWGLVKALRRLRESDPNGTYDFNHIYLSSGSPTAASPTPTPADAGAAVSAKPAGAASRIGLIDSGIELSHPVFRGTPIHTWGCASRAVASAHGTAVASLLLGQGPGELYAADVFCGEPTGGAVDVLVKAFAWLAQLNVAVINVSLVGPDNATLAQIVRALTSSGYLLVAAVGNDGPAAPPLYPASYPRVVGVTAVDAHRRVLIEAARGNQVMFAAQGADMMAADNGGKYSAVRGTSFAAPIVAALLARELAAPDTEASETAVQELARHAIDLGPPGRDLTYGYGLVGAEKISPGVEEILRGRRINR